MSQTKTARAFRTISEAGEELGLQPHVLRFWESKFTHIKPIKRGGGRRFYRPEDIEFIRGIKKLLHDEKHPIKDVQKLIRKKGPSRVVELGRSLERAAREQRVDQTDLLPERIKPAETRVATVSLPAQISTTNKPASAPKIVPAAEVVTAPTVASAPAPVAPPTPDTQALKDALKSLEGLKSKLSDFRKAGSVDI
jgi:DNA-binding transcriptional MerR regulator